MEVIAMLFGFIFWSVVLAIWFAICRWGQFSRKAKITGTVIVLFLPTVSTLFTLHYLFVDEPLWFAVSDNDTKRVRVLLMLGANPNIRFEDNPNALEMAVREDNTEIVRLLVANGASVNDSSNDWYNGKSPLANAKASGKKEIVRILEQAGAKE